MTTLCILDDDAMQLQMLELVCRRHRPSWTITSMLREAGHQENLPQADCVLLDHGLIEHLDEPEFMRYCCQTPVVVISGSLTHVDRSHMNDIGVRACLPKPQSLDDAAVMLERCEQLMSGKRYTDV